MAIKPFEATDIYGLLLSLSDLQALEKLSEQELEPPFDPLVAKLWKAVDWNNAPDISDLDLLSHGWQNFIKSKLQNLSLSKFVNFYIYLTIESLQESCKDSVDELDLLRQAFAFYDLLCDYKYLDKRVKKLIEGGYSADVEATRSMFYGEIYGKA